MGAISTLKKPIGYEKKAVSTGAVGLSSIPTSPGLPTRTLIRVTGAGIRYRDDGTDPTASDGFPLNDGEILDYDCHPTYLKFIRSGGTDATLYVLYYID